MSEAEKMIRVIIDTEIKPALAMDGGDIEFIKFEEGKVLSGCRGPAKDVRGHG